MNLYHYCPNANFVSIVSSREIWASELSLSNDVLEGKWIREIFSQYCTEKGLAVSDSNALLFQLNILLALFGAAGFCMSENGDLLSQWRAYADDGAGVSIGFNDEYLKELGELKFRRQDKFNARLVKIEYETIEQKKLIAEHADTIITLVSEGALKRPTLLSSISETEERERQSKFIKMVLHFFHFFPFIHSFKNSAFAEEQEWRIISHIIVDNDDDFDFERVEKMDYRTSLDRIIPFTRIPLEPLTRPSIVEVILGPRNLTPEPIVRSLLSKFGWNEVTVRRSSASYRK